MFARIHTQVSNRARRSAVAHKPVFKSVLENPFQISWPSIPANVQNIILARLVTALENVPPRSRGSRKLLRNLGSPGQEITEDVDHAEAPTDSTHLVGINTVTKALEHQLRLMRKHVIVDGDANRQPAPSPIVLVFVCSADVDPAALIDHIPYLVAGCNSPRNATQPIKLIPLPKGSESTISQILGVRRAAVVAFRYASPSFEMFQDILDPIPIVSAPWLCPSDTRDTAQLVPTHVKQLRTTAPKDMKAAREQRAKARAAAKKKSSKSVHRKLWVTLTTGSEGTG